MRLPSKPDNLVSKYYKILNDYDDVIFHFDYAKVMCEGVKSIRDNHIPAGTLLKYVNRCFITEDGDLVCQFNSNIFYRDLKLIYPTAFRRKYESIIEGDWDEMYSKIKFK